MAEEDIAPQVGAALEAGEEEEEAVMRIGERPGARTVVQQSASDRSVEDSCWGAGCSGLLINRNWTSVGQLKSYLLRLLAALLTQARPPAGKRCYVGNLAWSCSWQTLKDKFRDVGTVVYANVMRDDSGEPGSPSDVQLKQLC